MELLRVVEMNHCGQAAHRPFGNYPEMAKVLLLRQHGVGKREGDRRRRRMIEREEARVFGTIGRKVRLVVLDSGGGDDSIHGCFADAELGRDGCPGGTFGG